MAGSGSCQGSPTASRRRRRGLDTSLTPGSFLRHVGNVQVWLGETSKPETKTGATEVMFHADMGSPFRFRCVSRNGRMLLCRSAVQRAGSLQEQGEHRA